MTVVKATVRLLGLKSSYVASSALVDTGIRMTLVDRGLAEYIGVEYTGRKLSPVSMSGHRIEAVEALIPEFVLENEALKHEAVAVAEIPGEVREALRRSGLDERIVVGLLTLGRAGMRPNTVTGKLERVEIFVIRALLLSSSRVRGKNTRRRHSAVLHQDLGVRLGLIGSALYLSISTLFLSPMISV